MTSSWFCLSTLNYDARSTTHQIYDLPVLSLSALQFLLRVAANPSHCPCSSWPSSVNDFGNSRWRTLSIFYSDIIFTDVPLFTKQIIAVWMARDSVVSIAFRYGLDGPGIESWRGGLDFPHPHRKTLRAHPVSYAVRVRWFPGVMWPEYVVIYPPVLSAEVKERVELYFYLHSRF